MFEKKQKPQPNGDRTPNMPMPLPPRMNSRSEEYARAQEHLHNLETENENLRGHVQHLNAMLDVAQGTNNKLENDLAAAQNKFHEDLLAVTRDFKTEITGLAHDFRQDILELSREVDDLKRSNIELHDRYNIASQIFLDGVRNNPRPADPDQPNKPETRIVPSLTLADFAPEKREPQA